MKFRKKPVVIDAIQWNGENYPEIVRELKGMNLDYRGSDIIIRTLEGDMKASIGDWIIRGVNGELYPCKPDIFEKTYETVGDWK